MKKKLILLSLVVTLMILPFAPLAQSVLALEDSHNQTFSEPLSKTSRSSPSVMANVPATTFWDSFASIDTSTWNNGTSDAYNAVTKTYNSITSIYLDSDQGGADNDNCTYYMTWNLTTYRMYFRVLINDTSTDQNGTIIGVYKNPEIPIASEAVWRIYQTGLDGAAEGNVTMDVGNGDTTTNATLTVNVWYDMLVEVDEDDDVYWYINGQMQNDQAQMAGDVAPDADTGLVLGDVNNTDNCNNIVQFDYVGYSPYDSTDQGTTEFENFVDQLDTVDWRNSSSTPATFTTGEDANITSGIMLMDSTNTASDLSSVQYTYNRTTSTVIYTRLQVYSDGTSGYENASAGAPILMFMGTGSTYDGGGKGVNTLSSVGSALGNGIFGITFHNDSYWNFTTFGTGSDNATDETYQYALADDTWHNFKITLVGNQNSTTVTIETGTGTDIVTTNSSSRYICYDSFFALGDSDTGAENIDMSVEYFSVGVEPAMNITITDNQAATAARGETVTYTITATWNYDNRNVQQATCTVTETSSESPTGFPQSVTVTSGTGTFTYASPTNADPGYTFDVETIPTTNSYNSSTLNSHTSDTQKYYTSGGGGGDNGDDVTTPAPDGDGSSGGSGEDIVQLGDISLDLAKTVDLLADNLGVIVGISFVSLGILYSMKRLPGQGSRSTKKRRKKKR